MNKNKTYSQSIKIEIPFCIRCKCVPQEYYKLWNDCKICKNCYDEIDNLIKEHHKQNED